MKAIYKNIFPIIGNQRFKCGRSQGAWSYDVAQEQIKAQKDENALDRDWNTQEAEKARAFDMEKLANEQAFANQQRLASQEYQSEEWQRQFDVQNEYNDPVAQAERLRRAGINPQIAMSGDSAKVVTGSSVAAPSGSSPSPASSPMASGRHGLSPVPFSPGTNLAQDLSQVAGALDSFGKAVGQGLENTLAAKTMQSMISMKSAQAMGQELMNQGQKTLNAMSNIKLSYADRELSAKVTKLVNEGLLAASQGKHFDKLSVLDEAQTELIQTLSEKYGYEGQRAAMEAMTFMDEVKSRINLANAKASEALANADLSGAKAQSLDAIRPYVTEIERCNANEASRLEFFRAETAGERFHNFMSKVENESLLNYEERQTLQTKFERAYDLRNARESHEFVRYVEDFFDYASDHVNLMFGASVK